MGLNALYFLIFIDAQVERTDHVPGNIDPEGYDTKTYSSKITGLQS